MAVSMDLWGVTETGFYCPTVEDIKAQKILLAKEIFGEDFDTDDLTPEGMIFRIEAQAQKKLCEMAEGVYYCIFPHTAKGVSLDRLCETVNLKRSGGEFSELLIRVYGTQGYIVEAGTEFKTTDGLEFYSVSAATINEVIDIGEEKEYYADVIVQCKERGKVGNVSNIYSTVAVNTNITSVIFLEIVAYGTESESDPEIREKYESVVNGMGTNTRNAIVSNVLRVAGVNKVIILDNNTKEDKPISDNLTIEAGTYAVIVYSDSTTNNEEIAQAIFDKQPLGIPQSGKEEIDIVDKSNTTQIVKFTYVATNSIDINVVCTVDDTFESGGEKEIEDNIAAYVNSLDIGQEVVYTRLYDCIYGVTGVKKVTTMTLNGATADIPISKMEVAKVGTITVRAEA